jgi:hypothetical protein
MPEEYEAQIRFTVYARLNQEANAANLNLFSAESDFTKSPEEDRETTEEDLAAARFQAANADLNLRLFLNGGQG